MDIIQELANSLGGGFAQTSIWLLVVYFALRKQYNLKPLGQAWRIFFGCLLAFTILNFFYLDAGLNSNTPDLAGLIKTLILPPIIVASILYKFHRET